MKRLALYTIVTFPFFFMACATPVVHSTPSGRPEVSVNGRVAKQAHAEIMNLMLNNRYNVKATSDTLLVFEKPIENVLAVALLGSKYDSSPAVG